MPFLMLWLALQGLPTLQFDELLIYHDPGATEIKPRFTPVIEEAVRQVNAYKPRQVVITTRADRAGSETFNQKLTERRAHVVADALVAAGVPRELIILRPLGETKPVVQTADGAAEPLNRLTVITLHQQP
jgi:outer membrane protein OmpA-like peptidoglycan-associated protein